MNVKLTTETARRSALILKETTHVPVLRVLWTQVQMELMLSALTLVRILFFSFAYCSFYRVILLLHKMQTVSFGWGAFFVSNLFEKDVYSSCHERGTKKKSPQKNRTSDFRIPRSDALPLSHRDSTVSEVYYEVHMTRVLTLLLFGLSSIVLYFFVCFYFVLFFSLRASRNCIKFWTAQSETWFPTLSLLFLWSLLSLYAFHRRVFWWDTPVWQSREMPQHSR